MTKNTIRSVHSKLNVFKSYGMVFVFSILSAIRCEIVHAVPEEPANLSSPEKSSSSSSASFSELSTINQAVGKVGISPHCEELPKALSKEEIKSGDYDKPLVGSHHRPSRIQDEVDQAFDELNRKLSGNWLYDGNEHFYKLMGFDEGELLRSLAKKKGKKDIYIVDVGAAKGGWANVAQNFIIKELSDSGKHFHIVSLTGSDEILNEGISTIGNVTQYRVSKFKIENIVSELKKRGIDLIKKADLIVSSWTLRHLVDPAGTLEGMYELLSPDKGVLLSTGFWLQLNDSNGLQIKNQLVKGGDKPIANTKEWWKLFTATHAKYLFRYRDEFSLTGEFMLMRTDTRPLNLPLKYVTTDSLQWAYTVSSGKVTQYQLTIPLDVQWNGKEDLKWSSWGSDSDKYYNDEYYGDRSSKDLFSQNDLSDWILHTWNGEQQTRNKMGKNKSRIGKNEE